MTVDGATSAAEALRRVRRIAGAVLGLMAGLFLATHLVPDGSATRLVRAMAEAGVVGGLADWFAVEALFRHPLGLPIPHTALLPRNQARAAQNVGRFFETHFLEPASLSQRLRSLGLGRRGLAWLSIADNAALVAAELTGLAGQFLSFDPPPRALARSRVWLRAQASRPDADAEITRMLAQLVKDGIRSTAAGEVLGVVRTTIDQNREKAVQLVQDRSRWYIASAVDRRIAGLIVDGVVSLLDELRGGDSVLRRDLETAFDRMVNRLTAEGTLARAVGEGREALVRSGHFDAAVLALAESLRDRLRDRIAADPDALAFPLAELIRTLAARSLGDATLCSALDARLSELAARLIGDMRPAISGYIAEVIAGWAPDELIARFEEEIGPDLQFIRINGAVLGALIGGVLFAVNALMG